MLLACQDGANTPAAINRRRANLWALWVTDSLYRSLDVTGTGNTFSKRLSGSVHSYEVDLKLMPRGWSQTTWDNIAISDFKPLFQIDLFCTKSIFSAGCPLALLSAWGDLLWRAALKGELIAGHRPSMTKFKSSNQKEGIMYQQRDLDHIVQNPNSPYG